MLNNWDESHKMFAAWTDIWTIPTACLIEKRKEGRGLKNQSKSIWICWIIAKCLLNIVHFTGWTVWSNCHFCIVYAHCFFFLDCIVVFSLNVHHYTFKHFSPVFSVTTTLLARMDNFCNQYCSQFSKTLVKRFLDLRISVNYLNIISRLNTLLKNVYRC